MARRKTDAERGVFGAWAYNTRDALDLSVEAIIDALPTKYHPATLRKVEGGGGKDRTPPPVRMWRELGNLYAKLADEGGVTIDSQPKLGPENAAVVTDADLVAAIANQTRAIEVLVDRLDTFLGPLGEVVADLLRERIRAANDPTRSGAPTS